MLKLKLILVTRDGDIAIFGKIINYEFMMISHKMQYYQMLLNFQFLLKFHFQDSV